MMSNKEVLHQTIESLVKTWQNRLQLDRWKILVEFKSLDGNVAETAWDDMYDYATMTFNDDILLVKPADYIEKTVIHELLHLHDRDRNQMFAEIEDSLSPDTFRLFERVVYQQTEGFVDRLASCFYDLTHNE